MISSFVEILMPIKLESLLYSGTNSFKMSKEDDVNGKIRTYEKKIGSLMTEVGSLKNEVGF